MYVFKATTIPKIPLSSGTESNYKQMDWIVNEKFILVNGVNLV